jgi:hypothetical protein
MDWFNFLLGRCYCGQKAVSFNHGIPECGAHTHDVCCASYLGDNCDCKPQEEVKELK